MGKDETHDGGAALTRLFDLHEPGIGAWTSAELAAMFDHQMRTPLRADLAEIAEAAGVDLAVLLPGDREGLSFGDLFTMDQPDLELLRLVKKFSQRSAKDDGSGLPVPIALAVYVLAIAASVLRLGQSVSRNDPQVLAESAQSTLAEPWVTGELRRLVEAYAATLDESATGR